MPPDQRCVYVSTGRVQSADPPAPSSIFRHTSPDSLRWQRDPEPVIVAASDPRNVVWWDGFSNEYVVIVRGWAAAGGKASRLALSSLTVPAMARPAGGPGKYFNDEIPTILVSSRIRTF